MSADTTAVPAIPPCRVTSWPSLVETEGTPIDTTWEDWFATFATAPRFRGNMKHPGWSAAVFEPCVRAKSHVAGMSALVLDYDEGATLDAAVTHWSDFYGLIHTTRSHRPDSHRFRVILPISRIVTADEYEVLWKWAEDIAAAAGHTIDAATKDPSRFWYIPGVGAGHPYETRSLTGSVIDPDPIITSARYEQHAASDPVSVTPQNNRYGTAALEKACQRVRGAAKGQRNDTLNKEAYSIARLVAGGVIDDGAARSDLRAAGLASGLAAGEVTATLGSAFAAGLKSPRVPELRLVRGGARPGPGPASTSAPASVDGATARPLPAPVAGVVLKLGDHVELAAVTKRIIETSPLTHDDGSFWRYDTASGVWLPLSDEVVKTTVAGLSGSWIDSGKGYKPLSVTAGTCSGVASIVRDGIVADPKHPQFREATPGVAFRDRFVTVVDGEIRFHAHAPDHLARAGLPFDYDPLPFPKLDRFLRDIFAEADGTPCDDADDRIKLLQEFIGACLLGMATSYQRCLVFYGTGNNGKSQVIDACRAAFPDGTVVALSPQQWDEKFRLPLLVGALANFVGELPSRDIASSEIFKDVVVGAPQTGERKNRDPFTFVPRCGHLFASNHLPTAGDVSAGFFRRFVILPFTRVFPESGAGVERDIGARIAREERVAIAAWAVEGAARLQRQGGYTIPASVAAIRDRWTRDSDSVRMWLDMKTEKVPGVDGAGIRFEDAYGAYAQWAKALGFSPCNAVNFSKRYVSAGYGHSVIKGRGRYYIRTLDKHET